MRKSRIFSALIILFSMALTASAQTADAVELTMQFRGAMPAVEVMVNGKGPFLFAIDTGAQGMARADASLVERLGLKTSGQVEAGDGSGQNRRMLDTVELDSLVVGGIKFGKVTAITRDYNTSPNLPRIDGILGFDLFAEYLLTLDYPSKKVRLARGALPPANARNILNYDASRPTPTVELQVGKQTVKADVDSGNLVAGFILPTAVVEKSALASEPVVVGKARTVSNEVEIKQVRLKDSIRLGSFEFTEPTVSFPALSVANIGSRILNQFAVTFDQKNKRLELKRTGAAEEKPSPAKLENSKDYVGTYGDRTVTEDGGALYIQRPRGMRLKLASAARDEFTVEQLPAARIKFTRDAGGKIVEIQVLTAAGVWEKAARDK